MNIVKEIFYGNELTEEYDGKTFILNKWSFKKPSILIPTDVALKLIEHKFLIEDSGNFDTGEVHYTYNTDLNNFILSEDEPIYYKLKQALREIRLNNLLK